MKSGHDTRVDKETKKVGGVPDCSFKGKKANVVESRLNAGGDTSPRGKRGGSSKRSY